MRKLGGIQYMLPLSGSEESRVPGTVEKQARRVFRIVLWTWYSLVTSLDWIIVYKSWDSKWCLQFPLTYSSTESLQPVRLNSRIHRHLSQIVTQFNSSTVRFAGKGFALCAGRSNVNGRAVHLHEYDFNIVGWWPGSWWSMRGAADANASLQCFAWANTVLMPLPVM